VETGPSDQAEKGRMGDDNAHAVEEPVASGGVFTKVYAHPIDRNDCVNAFERNSGARGGRSRKPGTLHLLISDLVAETGRNLTCRELKTLGKEKHTKLNDTSYRDSWDVQRKNLHGVVHRVAATLETKDRVRFLTHPDASMKEESRRQGGQRRVKDSIIFWRGSRISHLHDSAGDQGSASAPRERDTARDRGGRY